jgi:ABC-2 type transport system permease protein
VASPLSSVLTFGWRAMLKIKHVPEQLLDVTRFTPEYVRADVHRTCSAGAIAGSTPSTSTTPAGIR